MVSQSLLLLVRNNFVVLIYGENSFLSKLISNVIQIFVIRFRSVSITKFSFVSNALLAIIYETKVPLFRNYKITIHILHKALTERFEKTNKTVNNENKINIFS